MTPDHYAILGVEPGASAGQIRAAYLTLLREHHPDHNPSPESADRTRDIIAAFRVLGDFDRRSRYDWDRRRDREAAEAAAAPRPVNRAALAAGAMAILALGGLLLKPDVAPKPRTSPPRAPAAVPIEPAVRSTPQLAIIRMKPALRAAQADKVELVEPTPKPGPKTLPSNAATGDKVTARPAKKVADASHTEKVVQNVPPPRIANKAAANLASLDQFVMNFYGQSWRYGDAAKRAALAQSRASFVARRDACVAEPCTRAAYLALMRDVSAIVESGQPRRR